MTKLFSLLRMSVTRLCRLVHLTYPNAPNRPPYSKSLTVEAGNSNSEGKRKAVRVSGGSSYRGQLNIHFCALQYTGQCKLNISRLTVTRLCILMIIQYCDIDREMTVKYVICSLH